MTLVLNERADQVQALGRALVVLAVVVAFAIAMSFVFGVHVGPIDYSLAPDPAGNLPF
jgi:hypothetical protein